MDARTALTDEAIELVYFMRGAVQYFDMWETTYYERQRFSKFIEQRLKDEGAKPASVARVY
jgi:hypothetical protein